MCEKKLMKKTTIPNRAKSKYKCILENELLWQCDQLLPIKKKLINFALIFLQFFYVDFFVFIALCVETIKKYGRFARYLSDLSLAMLAKW